MKEDILIFISYALEDFKQVKLIYNELCEKGYHPWIDKEDLLPGEQWEIVIKKTINKADFFLFCISENSVRKRSYLQKELRIALNIIDKMLDTDIFIIPVCLTPCVIPDKLKKYHFIDLYKPHGMKKLLEAITYEIHNRINIIEKIDGK